ncbi:uncharacterized protein LOC129777605 [Toxorhynchites rutilus septentrionalis]|uniref:uncharacterized protein LOC129777605 n=1 Tax=Toxorhynchites rutilus septentrionalis TaxID=329112 RepID=UPI002478EA97|nr:uncharacterized protein LOC129777605 [Toxorhynchites rutilus septentrionalis]
MQVGRNLLEADSEQSAKFKSRIVCVVLGCKQRYRPGISFHAFPPKTDKSRYLDWIQRLRLKIEPTKTSRISSLHFTVSNFYSPTTSRATDRLILRPSAVPDLNLPQPPISEARKRLIEGRAERAANRAKVGAAMDQRHDTPNLSDLAIDAECADHPEVCVSTVEKAVQVDTTDLDKLKVKRISAISFGSDDDLVSWTGLKSREMLESIVKAVTLVKQYRQKPKSTVKLEEEIPDSCTIDMLRIYFFK